MARRTRCWIDRLVDRLMVAIQGPDDQGAFPPNIGVGA
jgi:hypothetical protein